MSGKNEAQPRCASCEHFVELVGRDTVGVCVVRCKPSNNVDERQIGRAYLMAADMPACFMFEAREEGEGAKNGRD